MVAALLADPVGFYRENDLELPSELRKLAETPPESGESEKA
jgi:hypothetical protein